MTQTLAALLTPTIAAVAIVIAFLQWRTAHQKVVMDLFERRLNIYDETNKVVAEFWAGEGNLVSYNAGRKMAALLGNARFLFGNEVSEAIQGLGTLIHQLGAFKNRLGKFEHDGPEREAIVSKLLELEAQLEKWPQEFSKLCLPYLKMDQKRSRTPAEWFHDRNALRKSFGDKHQV